MSSDFVNYKVNPFVPVSTTRVISAASTNAQVVNATKTNVVAVVAQNNSGTVKYLRIYDKATTPLPASDVPVASFNIPAGQTWTHNLDAGIALVNGFAIDITGGIADTDTTATAANDVMVTFVYAKS